MILTKGTVVPQRCFPNHHVSKYDIPSDTATWNMGKQLNLGVESPILVLSPDFLPELKKLPDNVVSMEAAVDEV